MAALIPDFPADFSFTARIPVRITDINYGNHVGNDAVLSLLHEARMQFLGQFGFTELNCGGAGLIMKDVAIEFKKEIHYGQVLLIDVQTGPLSRVSFELYYRIRSEGTDTVSVQARTGMVCFDYSAKKIMGIPEAVRKAFGS